MRQSEITNCRVNPATFARLANDGILHRPSPGLYELANAEIGISHSLAEVTKRVPKSVVCLVSALQLNEIALQTRRSVWIAIGSKDRKSALKYPPTRVVRFN